MRNTGLASKSTERQTSPAKRGKRRIARRCPAFAQIKPAKINPSLFGRLLGTLEGADHVDLVEGTIGGEVDDKRKAKGKHHGKHVAQRLDFDVKVQRRHLQNVRKTLGQQAAQRHAQRSANRREDQRLLVDVMVHLTATEAQHLNGRQLALALGDIRVGQRKHHHKR